MKKAYPVILAPDPVGFLVTTPDIDRNTQGADVDDAIFMARDMLALWGVAEQDAGRAIPDPSMSIPAHEKGEIITFVDVDFAAYRLAYDMTCEKTNVTIPRGLKRMAQAQGLSFSQVLQDGLRARLGL